jgi:3-dehydroquinate synthetase
LERLESLLARIGLPTHAANLAPVPALLESMARDKKVAGGRVRLVLPDRLGAVSIVADTPDGDLAKAWESLGAR